MNEGRKAELTDDQIDGFYPRFAPCSVCGKHRQYMRFMAGQSFAEWMNMRYDLVFREMIVAVINDFHEHSKESFMELSQFFGITPPLEKYPVMADKMYAAAYKQLSPDGKPLADDRRSVGRDTQAVIRKAVMDEFDSFVANLTSPLRGKRG